MADDRGVDKKKDETGETDKSDKVHGAYTVGDRLVGIPPHW
jgi:hypothetical protein